MLVMHQWMRASHPQQLILKPLYFWNIGYGSTWSDRCCFGTTVKSRWKYWETRGLYFQRWFGISFYVEHMFVGSILNRTAYLPRLDEGVRVRQLKMRLVHLFLLLSQGNDAEKCHYSPERRTDEECRCPASRLRLTLGDLLIAGRESQLDTVNSCLYR